MSIVERRLPKVGLTFPQRMKNVDLVFLSSGACEKGREDPSLRSMILVDSLSTW